MFPKVSSDHIIKCLKQGNGHMNTAVELLLMDCQSSQVVMHVYFVYISFANLCRVKLGLMIKT